MNQNTTQKVYSSQPVLYDGQHQNSGQNDFHNRGAPHHNGYGDQLNRGGHPYAPRGGRGGSYCADPPPHHNNGQVRGGYRGRGDQRGRGGYRGRGRGGPRGGEWRGSNSNRGEGRGGMGYEQRGGYQQQFNQYNQEPQLNYNPMIQQYGDNDYTGQQSGPPPYQQNPEAPAPYEPAYGNQPTSAAASLQQQYENNKREYQQAKKLQHGSFHQRKERNQNLAQLAATYAAEQQQQQLDPATETQRRYSNGHEYQNFQSQPVYNQQSNFPPGNPQTFMNQGAAPKAPIGEAQATPTTAPAPSLGGSIIENYKKAQQQAALKQQMQEGMYSQPGYAPGYRGGPGHGGFGDLSQVGHMDGHLPQGGPPFRGNYRGNYQNQGQNRGNYRGRGSNFNPNYRGRGSGQNRGRGNHRGGGQHPFHQHRKSSGAIDIPNSSHDNSVCNDSDLGQTPLEATSNTNASPKVQTAEDLEEIRLWVESRKKNFPSKQRIDQKAESTLQKQEIGLAETEELPKAKLSKIEIRLRKKLKIIKMQIGNDKSEKKKNQKQSISNQNVLGKRDIPEKEGAQIIEQPHSENKKPAENFKEKKRNQKRDLKMGGAIVDNKQNGKSLILNFRYRKNKILEELMKNQQEKEMGIIFQCFRFLVKNSIV